MSGSSNFLQWNPTQANQESDAAYLADSSRTGGAGVDGIFPSATANKLFYQPTTFIAAFAAALALKGYNLSDASVSTLQGVLANVITTADINGNLVVVAYAPSVLFNCGTNNGFQLTLTGNVTSSSFSGMSVGQEITVGIQQDGAGGRTFVWPTGVNNAGTVDPTANTMSIQRFKKWSDGTVRAISPMVLG
jgi:hypothetical protein